MVWPSLPLAIAGGWWRRRATRRRGRDVTRGTSVFALTLALALAFMSAPVRLDAQAVKFRFLGVDMLGGAVWPGETGVGVAFGTRVGIADLFDRTIQLGLEMDWWTAELRGTSLDVRDIMGGLSLSRAFAPDSWLAPYLGLGISFHSFNSSFTGTLPPPIGAAETASRLDGLRAGGSGLGGLTLRLTKTGAIRLLLEYRYTLLSELSHHELRAGVRLLFGRR